MLYNAFLWRRTFTGTRTPSARFIFPVLSPLYLIPIRQRGWRFAFPFPVLLSCTTFSVYVNFSKNSSLSGRKPQRNSLEERPSLFAVAKVHRFRAFHKHRHHFFQYKVKLFFPLIIYIARAKLFWDIRGKSTVSGVVWDGGRRKRFLYLSEQYYFPWRWSITSPSNEVLLLSHLKYYFCFNITFYLGGRWPN